MDLREILQSVKETVTDVVGYGQPVENSSAVDETARARAQLWSKQQKNSSLFSGNVSSYFKAIKDPQETAEMALKHAKVKYYDSVRNHDYPGFQQAIKELIKLANMPAARTFILEELKVIPMFQTDKNHQLYNEYFADISAFVGLLEKQLAGDYFFKKYISPNFGQINQENKAPSLRPTPG